MEKVIKFLVNNQTKAYSVVEKLKELENKGEISLAESYVLEKDSNGKVTLKDERGTSLVYTATGALSGGLIGLLAGPAGFLLGTAFGGMFGSLGDLWSYSSQDDILDAFGKDMPSGKSMVISHIYEDWNTPIDTTLDSLAEIERIDVDEEVDKAIQADIDELDKKIDESRQNFKDAINDEKEKRKEKQNELKEKRRIKKEQLHANTLTRKKAFKMWFETFKKKVKQ